MASHFVETFGGRTRVRVHEEGSGEPLVYLHGIWGVFPNDPFLAALARRYHVFAPMLPGYEGSEGDDTLREMLDFVLHGFDVIEALGLQRPLLVGHSLGGMIAAEMAAICPQEVERLALISPFGLWLDDHIIPDVFGMTFGSWPDVLFADPEAHADTLMRGKMTDPEFAREFLINNARTLTVAGKIMFPIPDRRLCDRLHRIKAKTLLIWGERDRLMNPVYADAFKAGMSGARSVEVAMIPDAAHMSVLEKPAEIVGALGGLD